MKWLSPLKKFWTKSPKSQRTKLIVMLFIISLIFLLLPSSSKKELNVKETNTINQPVFPVSELESLLTEITGTQVRVLVAYADSGSVEVISEESVVAETEPATGNVQHKTDQKPVLDANKNVQIKNKLQPRIKGVCIFCFGEYRRETEELLYRAAKGSLGAELHTVEVIFETYPTR